MTIVNVLKHPNMLMAAIWARVGGNVSDETYLRWRYRFIFGKKLNLENPKSFNEKINWLKIYNRNPLYPKLVDKSEVKKYVSERIGEEYVIPTYGVWNSFDEIDFDRLPNQFVLKSTNGGGGSGVVICRDKKKLDKDVAKQRLKKSMHTNWKFEREWVYRDVKPRIIAEKLLSEVEPPFDLSDYKFFCFNGEPRFCQVIKNRRSDETVDFYDMDWKLLPFNGLLTFKHSSTPTERPQNIEEMKTICRKLSKEMPFVRVDLYCVNQRIYFGELTFYPAGGIGTFSPAEYNEKIGELLSLDGLTGRI